MCRGWPPGPPTRPCVVSCICVRRMTSSWAGAVSRTACPPVGGRGACCALSGSADCADSSAPRTASNPFGVTCFVAFRTSHSLPCNQKYCGMPRLLDTPMVRAMFGASRRQFLYAVCSARGSLLYAGFGGVAKPCTCPSVVAIVCSHLSSCPGGIGGVCSIAAYIFV